MISSDHDPERSARRLAGRMRRLILSLAVVVAAGAAYLLWQVASDPAAAELFLSRHLADGRPVRLTAATSLALAAVALVQAGTLLAALKALSSLFAGFERGDPLGFQGAVHIRAAGRRLLAFVAIAIAARPLATLLVSLNNPPGERYVTFAVGSNDLLGLLACGVLFTIGHVLALAARVNDDNRQIV